MYVRTKTVGATVTESQPCAFVLPWLLMSSTPLFAYCNDRKGGVLSLAALSNHNKLHSPASFNLVLGEAVVTVFVVETACGDGKME